jgi:hypothetical protein
MKKHPISEVILGDEHAIGIRCMRKLSKGFAVKSGCNYLMTFMEPIEREIDPFAYSF